MTARSLRSSSVYGKGWRSPAGRQGQALGGSPGSGSRAWTGEQHLDRDFELACGSRPRGRRIPWRRWSNGIGRTSALQAFSIRVRCAAHAARQASVRLSSQHQVFRGPWKVSISMKCWLHHADTMKEDFSRRGRAFHVNGLARRPDSRARFGAGLIGGPYSDAHPSAGLAGPFSSGRLPRYYRNPLVDRERTTRARGGWHGCRNDLRLLQARSPGGDAPPQVGGPTGGTTCRAVLLLLM